MPIGLGYFALKKQRKMPRVIKKNPTISPLGKSVLPQARKQIGGKIPPARKRKIRHKSIF